MEQTERREIGFFDIITNKQVYLSLIYLMFAFPLGLFYFVFIVTGISVGIGLIPIFIGIPILYVFMVSIKYIMKFERKMAAIFLGMNIADDTRIKGNGIGILRKFKDELLDKELWKALTYLFMKFFLGILVFILCVTLTSLSLGLIAAPLVYQAALYYSDINPQFYMNIDGYQVDSLLGLIGISATPQQEAMILMILGVFVGIGSMHLFNITAYFMGGFLKLMSPIGSEK